MSIHTELTLEQIASELDRLTVESQGIDLELVETDASMAQLKATLESIDGVIERVKREGASRETALVLEQHVEGVLPKRYPVASFTSIPSKTNYAVAMEAASAGKMALIAGVVAAIIAGIYKIIKWVIHMLRGSKNSAEAAGNEAAQAFTAAETAQDIVKGKDLRGDLKFNRVDNAEIDKLRKEVFIDPAKKQISKMTLLLLMEKRPTLRNLYSEVCGSLFGKSNLFTLTDQAINATSEKIVEFIKKSKRDESSMQLELVEFFEQPLRSVVYTFAEQGMLDPEHDFQGQRFSRVKQALTPVRQDQYAYVIKNMTQLLTSPANLKACDDVEAVALMEQSRFFNPAFYQNQAGLDELEKEVRWFLGQIVIPHDTETQISKLEESVGKLKKNYDELLKRAHQDPNSIPIAQGMLQHINAYQADIHFLSRLAFSVRFLQRDVGMFFRLMMHGETACVNYLKSLLTPESEGKFRDLIAEKRKKHAATVARFKGYIGD